MNVNLTQIFSKDVTNTGLVNIVRLLTGFISILLIPLFLTKQVQGYWYSFGSIAAMSVLADLGFTSIIIQFAAHEFAYLKWNNKRFITGNYVYVHRLGSLFYFILKRSVLISLIAFPLIFIIGYYILNAGQSIKTASWLIPWCIFILFSGFYFLLNLIASFFEGCGCISIIQKQRYLCNLLNWVVIYFCFIFKLDLLALALGMSCSCVFFGIQLWKNFKQPILQLLRPSLQINWNIEISPLLLKYAFSFIGGFLIFQLFTPIAFNFYGPVFAGQVGITITLTASLFQVANIWIYVAVPKINMLVSKENTIESFTLFRRHLFLSICTYLLLSGGVVILFLLMPENYTMRFLPFPIILVLLIVWLVQLTINSLATCSRAHKIEKFVYPSIVMGIYTAISTFLIATYLPSNYFFVGFFSSYIFATPWFVYVYCKHKKAILRKS